MIYESKIVAGISDNGVYGRKKVTFIKNKWRDFEELSEMYGQSQTTIARRILKGQPLDLTGDAMLAWTLEMKNGTVVETPLSVGQELCNRFLVAPSLTKTWNQFHKQGTNNWKVCIECGKEKPPREYHLHSRTRMALSTCRPCNDTRERKRRASYYLYRGATA